MRTSHLLRPGIKYAIFWSMIWWILSEGVAYQPWFALIVILTATIASVILFGNEIEGAFHLKRLVAFVPYFILQSWKGGVEVARRALSPFRNVHPNYIEYRLKIPKDDTLARVIFAACLCIFPGSLSCGIKGDLLIIHILDDELLDEKAIRDLETLIANFFAGAANV